MYNMIKKYCNLPNDELRNILLKKEEELDRYSAELHRMYGLSIPSEDFKKVKEKRKEIESIGFVILQRFKSMEIK